MRRSTDHCIKITYSGSLPATVKVYRGSLSGTLGTYLDLTVTKGSGNQEDCSDFVAGSTVYNSTLSLVRHRLVRRAGAHERVEQRGLSNGDAVTYKFSAVIQDNNSAKGLNTGTHSFTGGPQQLAEARLLPSPRCAQGQSQGGPALLPSDPRP